MCYLGPMKVFLGKLTRISGLLCYWCIFIRKRFIAGFSILPFYIHGHTSHFSYYADYSMHRCDTTFCIIRIAFADIFMPLYSYALKCWLWRIRQL